MIDAILQDRVISCLIGMLSVALLWPTMIAVSLWIRFTSYGTVLALIPLRDDSDRSVLCFACDGPVGDFLRRWCLHGLPALVDLSLARVTMLELIRIDWQG